MPQILTEETITRRLKEKYRPGVIASMEGYAGLKTYAEMRTAAVLIPLVWWKDEWQLVFTRRTEEVEHHKGQVSFPGGGSDLSETAPEQTALREAEEEIGVKPGDIRLLGRLNDVLTITNFRVTPVVGVMPWPYPLRIEKAEVVHVFTIPITWLLNHENWQEQPFTPSRSRRPFLIINYHPYNGEVLWGASARITHNFLSVLGLLS